MTLSTKGWIPMGSNDFSLHFFLSLLYFSILFSFYDFFFSFIQLHLRHSCIGWVSAKLCVWTRHVSRDLELLTHRVPHPSRMTLILKVLPDPWLNMFLILQKPTFEGWAWCCCCSLFFSLLLRQTSTHPDPGCIKWSSSSPLLPN